MSIFRRLGLALVAVAALAVWLASGAMAESRQIPIGGTGSAQTGGFTPSGPGDATDEEFATDESDADEGPDPYEGTISLTDGAGGGPSVNSGKKAKSNPTFNTGFEGLNFYQQRYARGGNQFSVEPPDQAMCDANGIYLTTNAYPWCCNGFSGAQIYALSKAQLAAGAANVTMQHIDTSGMVNAPSDAGSKQPGFTVWPAQSPGTSQFNLANNGTEYMLSSNAADEAQKPVSGAAGSRTSNQIVVWTLSNTASLNGLSPAIGISNKILTVGQYGVPPKQQQPGSGTLADKNTTPDVAQGDCINDTTTSTIAGV